MGKRYNFKDVPDTQDFGLVPLGRFPARLKIDAYQHDSEGNFMTNGSGERLFWQTAKLDDYWKTTLEILDTTSAGRRLFDKISFADNAWGWKRTKLICTRAGMDDDAAGELEDLVEDLDGTYWWVTVAEHEVRKNRDESPKESKYTFKNKTGCGCKVCTGFDGKKVDVDARIAFDGYELMNAKDAAMYKATTPDPDGPDVKENCLACAEGDHSHTAGKGCPCLSVEHPPF
jgi:hypothetical protein